jgi:murein DD-endopeptidase MepM/ murein hydrolase activator NlpD
VFKDGVQIGEADMLYAHFDDVLVEKGEIVDGDQIIGTQGRSGSTTGAHVSVDIYPVDGNIEAQNELLRQMRAKIQGR